MARDMSWPVCWRSKNDELEPLKVPVQAVAQVELDAERDLSGDQPAQYAQHEPSEPGQPDRDRPHDQVVAVAVADRVDRQAREVRDQHRDTRSPRTASANDHATPFR